MLPFTVPKDYFVELQSFEKKIPKYPGWRCSKTFKPFISPTAVETRRYPNGKYLFVLDFDYPEKYNAPIYKQFKYKDTYTRQSNHGLHLYYWSTEPREIIQNKKIENETVCNVDFKGLTINAEKSGSKGGYVVYYDFPSRNLPLMNINCNTLIRELYEMTGVRIVSYGDTSIYKKSKSQYILRKTEIQDYHIVIAKYLQKLNSDWTHAYDLSFKWGLKLSGCLADEIEAEAIATALMELVEYPHKENWVINFLNGFNCGDKKPYVNIGKTYLKYGQLFYLAEKLKAYDSVNMDEFLKAFEDLKLHQFIKLAKEVKKWN